MISIEKKTKKQTKKCIQTKRTFKESEHKEIDHFHCEISLKLENRKEESEEIV